MNADRIWLSSPHMGGDEQKYIQEAFDTNWIAPLGPNVTGFEIAIQNYLEKDIHVAALSSGTAALHLGLVLLGVKGGDEVICQTMTFSASANPILYQGATPIFIDSEPDTWNLCPIALEEAILDRIAKGKKPKAIIAVHLYGMPYNVDQVTALSKKYEIPVLEDSAEAFGSSYKGQKCGTFGDLGVLSFNGNKIITTSGGGALVCSSKTIKDKTVFLATQSKDDAPHYQHSEIGYNYRMSNICAGIGRGQMEVINLRLSQKKALHTFYQSLFRNNPKVTLLETPNDFYLSNYWLNTIVLDSYDTRESLRLTLSKANIDSSPLWKPMHLQPLFKKYPYYGGSIASDLFEKGLCLPSGTNLNLNDKKRISDIINVFFKF